MSLGMAKGFSGKSFLFFQAKIIRSGRTSTKCAKSYFPEFNSFGAVLILLGSGWERLASIIRFFTSIFDAKVIVIVVISLAFW